MNRPPEDSEYTFHPPLYSPFWAKLIYWYSDNCIMKKKHRVKGVKIARGGEELKKKHESGDTLLIAPNHSDHCDPHSLLHLSRRYDIPIHFMAARELFDKNKGLQGPLLQRAGVFSIDREGADLKSIKEAMRILDDAKYPLVMFPEGEIYHLNEKLTPLNEGAATLALRAAKKKKKEKSDKGVFIVPTAMRYSYIDDITATFYKRMDRLENHIMWKPQSKLEIVKRIYKFGEAVLSLKEKEYLDRTLQGTLDQRLAEFREILVSREEERYFSEVSDGNHPTRVRRLRGKIRSILLDGEKPSPEVREQCYDSFDNLYFAIQLYSYPGQYLHDKPSMDRIAETILKFEEDVFEENRICGERSVEITFCEPIDARGYLEKYAEDSKKTVTEITTLMESRIRKVLEN